jgi:thiol-disulfide isomerase/thioredoxin
MNRRQWMFGGVAGAAGVAGAGLAWWQFQPHGRVAGSSSERTGLEQRPDTFWSQQFDSPDGVAVRMDGFSGQPLLVNFWATWCPPCIEELPLLDRFYQANKTNGWQVLGLAIDQPSAVRAWLGSRPLSFPVAMAGFGGTELSKSLGNQAGALPFTVVFDAEGRLVQRKTGQLTPEDLAQWIKPA